MTALRGLAVLALTAALAVGLRAADHALLGAPVRAGWIAASTLKEVPAAAGPALVPPYVPPSLAWPPARILYRTQPGPGLWLGLAAHGETAPQLWIGAGDAPFPDELGCLSRERACPAGWRNLSGQRGVQVLSSLPGAELSHVLQALDH